MSSTLEHPEPHAAKAVLLYRVNSLCYQIKEYFSMSGMTVLWYGESKLSWIHHLSLQGENQQVKTVEEVTEEMKKNMGKVYNLNLMLQKEEEGYRLQYDFY